MNVLIVKMKNYLAPHHVVKHVLGLTFIFYIRGLLKALNEVDIVFAFWLCDSGKISYEKSSNEHSRELRYRTLDVWSHVLWFRCQLVEADKTFHKGRTIQICQLQKPIMHAAGFKAVSQIVSQLIQFDSTK